jgi:hypothetical protein
MRLIARQAVVIDRQQARIAQLEQERQEPTE